MVGWGRVYQIVDYWQLWLVKPAPTSTMYIVIYGWVGAGLSDCRLLAIMVGKTRPYSFPEITRSE